MTIAVAATFLLPDGTSGFLLAADARASREDEVSDAALKTFTLDTRVGAVESGDAMLSATAIEMTRGLIAEHNNERPNTPFTFYNTVRVLSFFLDRVVKERPWSTSGSEIVVAGFLQSGRPSLARIIVKHGQRTRVFVYGHVQPGSLIALTGNQESQNQIMIALRRAFAEDHTLWPNRVASTIWYLSRHEGTPSIGGGVALATCRADDCMIWPLVAIADRMFLRGIDVTDCYGTVDLGDNNKTGVAVEYDETWHAVTDAGQQMPEQRENEGFSLMGRYVDRWVPPADVFNLYPDPPNLGLALADPVNRATVVIRPTELVPSSDA